MLSWSIRKIFRRHDIVAGLTLIVVSYTPFVFRTTTFNNFTSLIIGLSFPLGVMLVANQIVIKLGGFSPISLIRGNPANNRNFTIVLVAFGAILGFIAADLGGLWYFPYWSASTYLLIGFLLGGWAFYFFFLIICYEATKLTLDKLITQKRKVTNYYSYEHRLYFVLFCLGLGMLAVVAKTVLVNTHYFTRFHYVVDQIKPPYISWQYWILTFFGLWFVCEYIDFRKHRSSLLKDTLHGYVNPLLAILVVSFILAITYEVQNQRIWLWRYANYPLAGHEVFNIPVFIILTWPLHIAGAVVFWRAFGNGSSSIVFANSKSIRKRRRSAPRKLVVAAAGARR